MAINGHIEQLGDLKAVSNLFDAQVHAREIVEDWLLITYDIPRTAEGDRARYEFLHQARAVGAVAHTESVYLMPWTTLANIAAVSISKVGRVYLWYARTDVGMARELTVLYDKHVWEWVEDVEKRIDRIGDHASAGKLKLAGKMAERTVSLIADLQDVVRRRGSIRLRDAIDALTSKLGAALSRGVGHI